MLLIGTILFWDKSGAGVHWKFLPLLRDFGSIGQYSWGSACLAYLYKALCRASRWHNWERGDRRYRYLNLAHFRKAFDELQEGQVAYDVDRVDPNIIPAEIHIQSVVWSATMSLVSFECIKWHATDRYNHVLSEIPMPSQHPLDTYIQLLGFMAGVAGQSQYEHQTEFMSGRYSLDARHPCHTSSVTSGGFVSVDSSRSDGGHGVLNSQNPNRVSMGLIEENANTLEQETDAYLVDNPNDEDDDEEDEIEEFD
ncbi:hypothetical protein Ahy_A06g030319 [Arachis hypogaea]|uniref:Aminotransferase-like plant mobile domain-containing protein n=1 Tax=Arachis hypogaea TaxID=3818 RepID=A0A445CVW6_ARAHY|nr:hypothetical protein Ahy_A06g030319 [Arachis hypogaea]